MARTQNAQLRPLGIVTDLPRELVPVDQWTGGQNIVMRDETTQRAPGYTQEFGTLLAGHLPEYLIYNPIGDIRYWLYVSDRKLAVTDGALHTSITPPSWTNPFVGLNGITGETINGLAYVNDGVNTPVYWDGVVTNLAADLPDWPANTTCRAMRPYKFFLVAMNIKSGTGIDEDLIQWSGAAPPGLPPQSWTTGPTSLAGSNVIGDITGPIIDGKALRDDFIIYKQGSTHLMQYVEGAEVFSFRTLFTTAGMLTRNAVADVRGRHFVLSDGDVIVHDGQSIESIIDAQNRRTLFSLLDPTNFEAAFAVYNDEADEILFCIPRTGETACSLAAVYDLKSGRWGFRDLPDVRHAQRGIYTAAIEGTDQTWDADTEVWDLDTTTWNQLALGDATTAVIMASKSNNKLYQLDTSNTADGSNINSLVVRESMDLGSPNVSKVVRRIWPKIKANPGTVVNVRVGAQTELGEGVLYSNPVPFTVGTDQSVGALARGKFISVEFGSDGANPWELSGYEIEYEERGRF